MDKVMNGGIYLAKIKQSSDGEESAHRRAKKQNKRMKTVRSM